MAEPIPMIEKKIAGMADEIAAARTKALSAASIDSKGAVKVPSDHPELKKIAATEQAIARLEAIKAEITGLYKTAGVGSREELSECRSAALGDIGGAPIECFKAFKMYHELPEASGGRPDLLPSDLCQFGPYQAVERRERDRLERAQATLTLIDPILRKLADLITEANSL